MARRRRTRPSPVLDLLFLLGVVGKGIDGLLELVGGVLLLAVAPGQLARLVRVLTAEERAEDPHDLLANLLLHGVAQLGAGTTTMLAAYVLFHGVVKVAIVVALLRGSRRVYPWAIGALGLFLVLQLYSLAVSPSVGVVVLTVLDAVIILLTWREWHENRTLHDTWRSTLSALRGRSRSVPEQPSQEA